MDLWYESHVSYASRVVDADNDEKEDDCDDEQNVEINEKETK